MQAIVRETPLEQGCLSRPAKAGYDADFILQRFGAK